MNPSVLRESQARKLRSDRFKLALMVVALIALVGGMISLGIKATGERTPGGEAPQPVTRQVSTDVPPMDLGVKGAEPKMLTVKPEDLEARFEFMKSDDVYQRISDQDTTLEPGPFFRLLYVVSQDTPEELKASAEEVDWAVLWEKPVAMRARPILIRGTITQIWPLRLGDNPMGLTEMWVYRIRLEDAPKNSQGHLFDVYAIEKLKGALRFDHVTVAARFLKAQIIEPESERFLQDPDLHVATCIARRFEPLTYLDEPELPQPIRDGSRPEARAFYYLLNKARTVPFAEIERIARTDLTYVDFTTNPDKHRGKPVVIQGELRRCVRMALPENILGARDVYYGQIVDADRKMNTFYVVDIPDGLSLKDPVLCYGYFLKNWTYVSQGNEVLTCAVVVGQRLVMLEYERSYTVEIALGVIVVATVGLLFIAYLRDRKRHEELAEARRARQLARVPDDLNAVARRRAAQAAGETPPPNDDS